VSAPAATVVIPARDAAASVGRCVSALAGQTTADGAPVRVVVVDDGSVDATGEVAAAAGAEVIRADGDGPARARNLGVAAAETPLVVFTDADCAPREGFVQALCAPFVDPAVVATKGAYLTQQRSLVARFVQLEYEERYDRMARRESIDFVDTYAAAYRREVLEQVGGFDERYRRPSTEDQELSFRVAATGGRLLFVPEARVDHLHADTLWGYARKKAKIGYFKVATLRRHPGKAVQDSHTPVTLKLQLLLAPLALAGAALAACGLAARSGAVLPGAPTLAAWGMWGLAPAAAFALTALPLWLRTLRHDLAVGLVAPALIFVRALALGVGVAAGLLGELRGGVLDDAPAAAGQAS
jgi:cellulose synthase/poly-beta-1,6-N-acetylglucosamine synthase-like glycosyltransferase